MRRIMPIVALSISMLFGGAALSETITISPTGGPPTTTIQVSGSGFAAMAAITIDLATNSVPVTADGAGSFSNVAIQVPASALPGDYTVTAVVGSGGTLAQTTFIVYTDWRQLGFAPNHPGSNPYENELSVSTVGKLALLWDIPPTSSTAYSSAAVVNGVIYVSTYSLDNFNVYAFEASTGSQLWTFTTGARAYPSPAVVNGVVYAGSDDDNVYALDASTGAKLWSYTTGGKVTSSPGVTNGKVFIGSLDNNLYAFNASTGEKLWNYTTGGSVTSSPAVANGVVYVGSEDNNLYAIKASDGAKLWNYTTGGGVQASPAVVNGVV